MDAEDLVQSSHDGRGGAVHYRDGDWPAGEQVDHGEEVAMTVHSFGQGSDDIDTDGVEGPRRQDRTRQACSI